jgi:hypothetical protein
LLVLFLCSLCEQVFQKGYCSADSFSWCENDCQLWTQCVACTNVSRQVATITDPLRSIASINSLTESASCSSLKTLHQFQFNTADHICSICTTQIPSKAPCIFSVLHWLMNP